MTNKVLHLTSEHKCSGSMLKQNQLIWIVMIAVLILQFATILIMMTGNAGQSVVDRHLVDECIREHGFRPKIPYRSDQYCDPALINIEIKA